LRQIISVGVRYKMSQVENNRLAPADWVSTKRSEIGCIQFNSIRRSVISKSGPHI